MTEQNKQLSIFAVLSLVIALIGILVFGGVFAGAAAIILGMVALNQSTSGAYRGKGLAVAGIVLGIVAGVMYFGATIWYKDYTKGSPMPATVKAQGKGAASSLEAIYSSFTTFYTVNQRYPENFDELLYSDPPYTTKATIDGSVFGYQYKIKSGLDSSSFLLTAVPLPNEVPGMTSFCVTEDGYIRMDGSGGEIFSYDECKRLPGI